mmetsp:Transcript_82788/g.181981  ORF Transcript_82788/g.181981 Transcript_82788/m.181981 type:complete len:247 (+) Transcript_82788:1292-2032(+)
MPFSWPGRGGTYLFGPSPSPHLLRTTLRTWQRQRIPQHLPPAPSQLCHPCRPPLLRWACLRLRPVRRPMGCSPRALRDAELGGPRASLPPGSSAPRPNLRRNCLLQRLRRRRSRRLANPCYHWRWLHDRCRPPRRPPPHPRRLPADLSFCFFPSSWVPPPPHHPNHYPWAQTPLPGSCHRSCRRHLSLHHRSIRAHRRLLSHHTLQCRSSHRNLCFGFVCLLLSFLHPSPCSATEIATILNNGGYD